MAVIKNNNHQISQLDALWYHYQSMPEKVKSSFLRRILTSDGDACCLCETDPKALSLSRYISDVTLLNFYVWKLKPCSSARTLAQIILEMCDDESVKIDKDEMTKSRFINTLLPLAPKVTTSISNIRKRIYDEYERQRRLQRR